MPGWDDWRGLLADGLKQAREEGREAAPLAALEPRIETVAADGTAAAAVFEALLRVPMDARFGYSEPNGLDEIKALRTPGMRQFDVGWDDATLLDKLHGAWLGRCAGCALGKPVEGMMSAHRGLKSWERQKEYLLALGQEEWPLRDYFPGESPAQDRTGGTWCAASTREKIAYMESDDDIRYTVIGQLVLAAQGRDFGSWDVARQWIKSLTYAQVCTAETQAYRNLVARYHFHGHPDCDAAVDWEWVACHENPYREWIGAQIRVDSYGYAAPGNPELAAEFAWRDARVSHVKNGIYGAMFCAAMIAAAFATRDVVEIVEAGLAEIPSTSRLYADLRRTAAICAEHDNDFERFEEVITGVYDLLDHYSPVHTNNNAALCVVALLLSGGDFHRGITLAVMGGLDTDCNGATVGSIVGAISGAALAPEHWVGRLNDTLNAEVIGYHPIAISECARRSLEIARGVRA